MPRILFTLVLAMAAFLHPLQALPEAHAEKEMACPVAIDPALAKYRCISGNQLTLRMPYFGVAAGVTVTISGPGSPTVGGDDPATTLDGVIQLVGLVPASPYVMSIVGTGCFGPDAVVYNFTTPNYTCGNDLTALINEVLPEPGSDTNDDGVVNYLEEQFVEVFNPDTRVEIDMDGWVLIIGGVLRYTFPPATILGPRQALTVFGGGTLSDPCHYAGTGFLSISANGDVVSLATPTFGIVHTMSFSGTSFPPNVSLALNPDGNIIGGFTPHTAIVSNPVNYSPCFSNHLPNVVLPVELTAFSATYRKGSVLLNWSTAREDDHAYFDVQRSADGQEWETFTRVGEPIADNEARNEDRYYEAEDARPPVGLIYYRLRQVDQDGATTNYGPQSVNVPNQLKSVLLYPNPAQNQLWVDSPARAAAFKIIDAHGKQWLSGQLSGESTVPVNIAELPAGMYFLRVLDDTEEASTIRWVKR